MVTTRQWILANKPAGEPVLPGDNATFKIVEKDLPEPKQDELLLKLLSLSNDPAQRTWIYPNADPERAYMPPVPEGAPMAAFGLFEVIESKSSSYKKGDTVLANAGWTEYAVVPVAQAQPAPDLPNGVSKTVYLGALGFTGLTAYAGVTEVDELKKEDVIVVSGAAGATGSIVVQIAKKIVGCKKIIGIAGTDEKCRWVEGLGADVCLNYKSSSFREDLVKETGKESQPTVYYDNVGGPILDLMLERLARHGRVIACGGVSDYNTPKDKREGIKNWFEIVSMRLRIKGFIVLDHLHLFPEFREKAAKANFQLEGSEHVVKTSFEKVPETWMLLFSGANRGKLITTVA